MLRPRVIPVLQLHSGWLTKTRRYAGAPYLGDPINAVRIFNELEVDELVLVDVSASRGETPLNPRLIESIASEAFMPVAYGGGIKDTREAVAIVRTGIEKIVINTAVQKSPELLAELAAEIGSQSIVASVDVRTDGNRVSAHVASGSVDTGMSPQASASRACEYGAGEILLSSIDRDGTRAGYDLRLIESVASSVPVPVLALGGAGSLDDFRLAVNSGAAAACAGSMFVYHGRHQAVLITYPSSQELTGVWAE